MWHGRCADSGGGASGSATASQTAFLVQHCAITASITSSTYPVDQDTYVCNKKPQTKECF